MRPEAKAQIYSVNENLLAKQAAEMWGVLDQFICLDVYQSLQ